MSAMSTYHHMTGTQEQITKEEEDPRDGQVGQCPMHLYSRARVHTLNYDFHLAVWNQLLL